MQSGCFQQVYRSERVHFKVQYGNIAGLVVRRLCGTMDDQIEAVRAEQAFQRNTVAYIPAS